MNVYLVSVELLEIHVRSKTDLGNRDSIMPYNNRLESDTYALRRLLNICNSTLYLLHLC